MGILCDYLTAYRNHSCEPDGAAVERLYALCVEQVAWVGVVTQASTAAALNRIASDWPIQVRRWMHAQPFFTIHPRIEQSLIDAGFHSTHRIAPGASALHAALSSNLWSTPRKSP
jgi:uroporphyrinogen-III synthase